MNTISSNVCQILLCLLVANSKVILAMELDYTKAVKQTFGVPGAPGNAMVGVNSPTLGDENNPRLAKEDQLSQTSFVLTVMILTTMAILLIFVLLYFSWSCLISCVICIRRIKERQQRSRAMVKTDSLTSSSSLESV